MKFSIKLTQITLSDNVQKNIESKLSGLDKYFAGILDARVEIEKVTDHHRKGDIYRAELNVSVPGNMLRAESVQDTIPAAIVDVKKKMEIILKKHKETRA